MSLVLSVRSVDHSHFCIHVTYSSVLLIVDFILTNRVLTSFQRSIDSKLRYDLGRRMSGWLKTRTCLFGELGAHSGLTLIAIQPGVTVRADTRPAQRKRGVWSGARAVKHSRRGTVRTPAAQNRGVPCQRRPFVHVLFCYSK
jgi:hypothetical protein